MTLRSPQCLKIQAVHRCPPAREQVAPSRSQPEDRVELVDRGISVEGASKISDRTVGDRHLRCQAVQLAIHVQHYQAASTSGTSRYRNRVRGDSTGSTKAAMGPTNGR